MVGRGPRFASRNDQRSPATAARGADRPAAGGRLESLLALASGAVAFAIALATAAAHVPLRRNPWILAFVAFDAIVAST